MNTTKSQFTCTVTEKDRLAAGPFGDCGSCLIATMLDRRGFNVISEGLWITETREGGFEHDYCGCSELHANINATEKPPLRLRRRRQKDHVHSHTLMKSLYLVADKTKGHTYIFSTTENDPERVALRITEYLKHTNWCFLIHNQVSL